MADSNFLPVFYTKLGDAIYIGLKVRGIKWGNSPRDINAAVTAGERMSQNMLAAQALESGDQKMIDNLVTVEHGVHPIKVETPAQPTEISLSADSINALSANTAKATAALVRNMLTPQPTKRKGRPKKT
jgi:hypothetical protein